MQSQAIAPSVKPQDKSRLQFGKWRITYFNEAEDKFHCTVKCVCGFTKRIRLPSAAESQAAALGSGSFH